MRINERKRLRRGSRDRMIVLLGAVSLFFAASASWGQAAPAQDRGIAVGPQYDTTHVYVAPADIDAFVRLVTEDVRFIMPPLTAWFDGREAVAAFVEKAIFTPARPHGVQLRAGSCNGQPAFATYEPDGEGHFVVSGLQVLQLGEVDDQPLITTLVSYRDPALAIRCGLPPALP